MHMQEKPRTRPEVILRHLTTAPGRVYNLKQAKRDINAVYSTGLFDDVNITPKESENSTESSPKVSTLHVYHQQQSTITICAKAPSSAADACLHGTCTCLKRAW